jgi:hypothetical protein
MSAEIAGRAVPKPTPDVDAFDVKPYDFWPKVACWTPEEATMLSLGLEPMTLAPSAPLETASQDSMLYRQRRLLILRAIEVGQLPSPLTPLAFIEWAKRYDVSIPEGLRQAINDNDSKGRRSYTDDNCHPKITASMQKMILAMAIGCYRWNPMDFRSTVVADIMHDLKKVGIRMNEGTVRSRLKEANDRYGGQSAEQPEGPG